MHRIGRFFALCVVFSMTLMAAASSSIPGPLFPPDPWEDLPPASGSGNTEN
jgi:hypothetical protein